ncbi:hypothetical protein L1286_18810 [Pseudoalteromonas sp. SMS1]|uniref:hypothetical protein n=1 Tax=Pseudoalteromonas sp. SMS1 TaxID=2908894 RepID=UPI001F22D53A|nr:hypothetical protein [Pseudoalteromonas sp. SMS1]MCF2859537.1 hypothetical protein [Pseudoalteromonas sp. SMS1]
MAIQKILFITILSFFVFGCGGAGNNKERTDKKSGSDTTVSPPVDRLNSRQGKVTLVPDMAQFILGIVEIDDYAVTLYQDPNKVTVKSLDSDMAMDIVARKDHLVLSSNGVKLRFHRDFMALEIPAEGVNWRLDHAPIEGFDALFEKYEPYILNDMHKSRLGMSRARTVDLDKRFSMNTFISDYIGSNGVEPYLVADVFGELTLLPGSSSDFAKQYIGPLTFRFDLIHDNDNRYYSSEVLDMTHIGNKESVVDKVRDELVSGVLSRCKDEYPSLPIVVLSDVFRILNSEMKAELSESINVFITTHKFVTEGPGETVKFLVKGFIKDVLLQPLFLQFEEVIQSNPGTIEYAICTNSDDVSNYLIEWLYLDVDNAFASAEVSIYSGEAYTMNGPFSHSLKGGNKSHDVIFSFRQLGWQFATTFKQNNSTLVADGMSLEATSKSTYQLEVALTTPDDIAKIDEINVYRRSQELAEIIASIHVAIKGSDDYYKTFERNHKDLIEDLRLVFEIPSGDTDIIDKITVESSLKIENGPDRKDIFNTKSGLHRMAFVEGETEVGHDCPKFSAVANDEMNFSEAQVYCSMQGLRLPSSAEFEEVSQVNDSSAETCGWHKAFYWTSSPNAADPDTQYGHNSAHVNGSTVFLKSGKMSVVCIESGTPYIRPSN